MLMSREFIENQKIKQYIDNPNCTIILFENPPFFDTSSMTFTENTDLYVRAKSSNRDSYVCSEFKKNIFKYGSVQASAREISNLFIWSAFTYYCRQNTDSYIVFSPVKYFKSVGLVSQRMLKGFAFNRVHFTKTNVSSGSKSVISCVLWANETSSDTHWDLDVFDIDDDHIVDMDKIVQIRRVYNSIVAYNDKRVFPDDVLSDVVCNSDGTENLGWRHKTKHSRYNANIVCYMASNGFIPDVKHRYLSRCGDKSGIEQSYGFMVRADNYLQKLPMWVAKLFPAENWFDIDVYFNTSDGGDAYTKDLDFLKSCLIYTCLSNQNKCLTFDGSDGRYYRNELCFDTDTLASRDLKSMTLDDEENSLMDLWYMILDEAKVTANYNPAFTYGVYQITKELNTFHDKIQSNGKVKKVPDYIELNGYLDSLRTKLKEYYKSHITEKMFEYELLK